MPCFRDNCLCNVVEYTDVCEAGHKQPTEDERVFGDVWVYCSQHMRPHRTGWCTVSARDKTKLDATNAPDAYAECKERGLEIFKY